jgi:FRG domain
MDNYKSNLFGQIEAPQSFSELINICSEKYYKTNRPFFWRGQSNIDWRIDSSAYRRLKLSNKEIGEFDLISYEVNLLEQATHKGLRFQNGEMLNDFELFAKLQHHGSATRLIDFSRNMLIALWFCSNENIGTTGLLFGIDSYNVGGYESQKLTEDYKGHIESIKEIKHPQTWEPPEITKRIAAQHSQFIYSRLSNDNRSSLELDSNNLFLAINPKLKTESISILETVFDIRTISLFPDIDGFGMANNSQIHTNKMWRW